jgi:uncharacterized protein (TIGR00266 family)
MADQTQWHLVVNGNSAGPMSLEELISRLPSAGGANAMVYGPGLANWTPAGQVPAIAARMGINYASPPPVPGSISDDVSYKILGNEIQYVEMDIAPGQMIIGEPGFLMYMTAGVQMNTMMGDPSMPNQGLLGKLMTAGKRVVTGESMFISTFTAAAGKNETLAFAAPHPGKIVPFDLAKYGGQIICQKDCFLCAARGVHINIAFQKRILTGLFGGEGFIMQRLSGAGIAMIAVGGILLERDLAPGETLRLEAGCLVAMDSSVNYDVQFVGGIRNAVFGGEGLFFATVTGPGKVWAQSMPFSRLAARVLAHYHPPVSANSAADGSILGMGLDVLIGRRD